MTQENEETYADEPYVSKVPNYEVSELAFLLQKTKTRGTYDELVLKIQEQDMAPYYLYLKDHDYLQGVAAFDQTLYNNMKTINNTKIEELKQKITKAEEDDDGELEKAHSWLKLGEYYAQIGDLENAVETLTKAQEVSVSTGAKIDILLTITRLGFFYDDQHFVKQRLEQVNLLIEKGGDWERRNRYKTYRGVHCLSTRNFKEAAELLCDSLATFTSLELTSYEKIATYASVAGLVSLERLELKNKIIDSPEILSMMANTKPLESVFSLAMSLYTSDYASFFPYLLETRENVILPCKYLNVHADYFMREMRRKVYSQLLESYKTLSLKSMANSFGVSVEFLDNDLSKFIPNKQLSCVIDRVNGIVETNRPDNKNAQFHSLIKQGDGLLTKLQKYGAAVRLTGDSPGLVEPEISAKPEASTTAS
ncbi:proteasome regulatory particle subunit [Hanseniaspora vineae]